MPAVHPPPAVALRAGFYEGQLMLAVAPDGTVRARYALERGVGVTFSCEVFFRGRVAPGGRVEATSWDGDPRNKPIPPP